MQELSSTLLEISFFLYLVATLFFGGTLGKKDNELRKSMFAKIGIALTIVGLASQLGYFFTRWFEAGHAPVSNLFEFTTFFGMMLILAFIVMYFMYSSAVLGLFALPIAILIIAYGSMFPQEYNPLVPSLQSIWLPIHVSTVALGQAILAISFIAGLIYLLKNSDYTVKSKSNAWLEFIIYFLVLTLGFVVATTTFRFAGYETLFIDNTGAKVLYNLPALITPHEGVLQTTGAFVGIEAHELLNAKKATTVIWSFLFGSVLYILIRLIIRKRLSEWLSRFTKNVSSDILDEIGARSVAIGFPVFTLGGLFFAMIWAQIAWGRFWGWDPKEVWALITWLFYAIFLHLRLTKGWHGKKSAWLAVIGFFIIMFNLIVVNLVLAGLHSYA